MWDKKNSNLVMILIVFFLVIGFMPKCLYASYDTGWTEEITVDVESQNEINNLLGYVYGVVQAAGVVISVIILVYIGIKYMLASAEEKAEYKKSMIPYLIGAVIFFAISLILTAIQESV